MTAPIRLAARNGAYLESQKGRLMRIDSANAEDDFRNDQFMLVARVVRCSSAVRGQIRGLVAPFVSPDTR